VFLIRNAHKNFSISF